MDTSGQKPRCRMAKIGRPLKYRKEFHPQDFIRLSKQGKSLTQIALAWDIDRDTIYEWSKRNKEFSGAVKKGRALAEAWYMDLGQQAMIGMAYVNGQKVKMDVGLFVWMTKNMFKWTDKVVTLEEDPTEERPLKDLSDEELDAL